MVGERLSVVIWRMEIIDDDLAQITLLKLVIGIF